MQLNLKTYLKILDRINIGICIFTCSISYHFRFARDLFYLMFDTWLKPHKKYYFNKILLFQI